MLYLNEVQTLVLLAVFMNVIVAFDWIINSREKVVVCVRAILEGLGEQGELHINLATSSPCDMHAWDEEEATMFCYALKY